MPEFAADLSDGDESGGPLQIGVGRELPAADRVDLAATTAWTALPGGGRVASFSVRSPGAVAIRAAVTATLPEGAVLRFFGFGDSPGRYPVVKNDVEMRWSPTVPGDTIGIEIELPPLMHESEVSLRVVRVSHLYRSASSARDSNTDSCSRVEVACKMLPACPNGAVARTIVTYPSGVTGACTGTSVNSNRARDDNLDAPYFLTAAHCIASQAVADTLETRWFYQYDSCETPRDASDFIELHGGADIVEVDTDTDSTLLRLRDALPNNACLAGWNARVGWTAGTDVTSLHHADGDPKQWAGGRIGSTGFHSDDGRDLIEVVWNEGFTLGGSSGSGLFTTLDGNDVLIGVLSAGTQCVAGVGQLDSFGRFDRFYDNHAGAHLQHDDPPPEDDHGDRVAEATSVVLESEVAGEIDHGSDADVFEIVVVQKGTLTVYTTGSVDTVGRLKREDGSTVAYNDDADYPTNSNFRIEVAVTPGNYYVKVSGYNPGDVGGYRLHVGFTASGAVVPLFLAASRLEDVGRQGFVRVVNRSDRSGEVRIIATDDAGQSPGTVTLALDAGATRAFNSRDLEEGNADKDLSGRTGAGTGDWRLALDSQLDIEVQAFVRTTDGFLTARSRPCGEGRERVALRARLQSGEQCQPA